MAVSCEGVRKRRANFSMFIDLLRKLAERLEDCDVVFLRKANVRPPGKTRGLDRFVFVLFAVLAVDPKTHVPLV